MLLKLTNLFLVENRQGLAVLPEGKLLINTINAHSYNTAQKDRFFAEALQRGDVLIPDGASIVKACRWLNAKSKPAGRIAGWDLFEFEMNKLNRKGGKCFFMGSSEKVLALIKRRAAVDFPHIEVETYSPPYKPEFSEEDNRAIVEAINKANPDLLWIGMTAPKYNPQIQISAESETKRSIFREKDKTKRSKKESAQHSKSRNKSFVMTSVSAL